MYTHEYSDLNDRQLTEMLRNGDRVAYTEVYNRYKRSLYLFAFKRLGDKEEVRDIIHEVFLNLWLRHFDINIEYTLSTYLHSAVRNKIANIISHRKVNERYLKSFNEFVSTEKDLSEHLIRYRELEAQIEKEIALLPQKMRQIFELSRKGEYSRAEIAKELNLSEETVKSHIHQAIKKLKYKLGPLLILFLIIFFAFKGK